MSPCWLCGSGESREVLPATAGGEVQSHDFKMSDSHYGRTARVVECARCGFRYADPLPASDLVELYTDLVDPEYREGSEGRIRPFRRIIGRCLAILPEARTLLDIGASTGLLCLAAGERGLDAVGVEPSAWAVGIATTEHGVKVFQGTFPHPLLEAKRFDIVTLIDVIEHVSDPLGLLRDIARAVAPGGLVVITTPDVGSVAARLLGPKWWHYRVAHVGYFNRSTMVRACARVGLQVERIEPYTWSFSLGYIAERLERYLPVGSLRRGLAGTRPGRALLRLTLPLNLGDSRTYYARSGTEEAP